LLLERHGTLPLPYALAAGESVYLNLEFTAPFTPGNYTLKIDMVSQHVCWFQDVGSTPLIASFRVAKETR